MAVVTAVKAPMEMEVAKRFNEPIPSVLVLWAEVSWGEFLLLVLPRAGSSFLGR